MFAPSGTIYSFADDTPVVNRGYTWGENYNKRSLKKK